MFDFDVITGPTNPPKPAKPLAPASPASTTPASLPSPAAPRDGVAEAERPAADPPGARR
jgi:hypothetical protein